MYSFQPVVDTSDIHTGFYILTTICVLLWAFIAVLWKEDEIEWYSMIVWTVILGGVIAMAYNNSYTPRHPLNEKLVGNFVGFQTEGYSERSGKSRVDRHYVYVIYEVNGYNVLFQASTGMTYPKQVIVYRN
jgi:hypothetical protein